MTAPTLPRCNDVHTCPKCGTTLIVEETNEDTGVVTVSRTSALTTVYHPGAEPGKLCWNLLLHDIEHLCRSCRVCQYAWCEQTVDPQ